MGSSLLRVKNSPSPLETVDYLHQGAFGLSIPAEKIDDFIKSTDIQLKDMPNEPIYYVDYIWSANNIDGEIVLDIANMDPYWGKDIDESIVAIQGIKITKDDILMMKSNTCKIKLPCGIDIIKFHMSDEEFNKLYSENGYVEINAICTCGINEWPVGCFNPQLKLKDYEIIGGCAYVF